MAFLVTSFTTNDIQAGDLTEDEILNAVGDTDYSSETDGVTLTFNVVSGTHIGALTGTLGVVMNMTGENNNSNRVSLNNTNNTFTGGLTIKNGTFQVLNYQALGASDSTITLENATLMMSYVTITQNMVLNSQFGALRPAGTVKGKISGQGDLVIHCDTNLTATLSNPDNCYAGITNIGGYNVPGSSNQNAGLKLGANEVLPNGTIVQIGVTYGAENKNTKLANSWLDMNGKTETISGLMGVGQLQNSSTTAVTLNITTNTKSTDGFYTTYATETEGYNFTGPIGVADKGLLTVNISGDGTQILGGSFTNAAVSVSDTATLSFGTNMDVKTLNGLSVANGATLKATDNATISDDGDVNLSGALSANALTITQTGAGSIYLGQAYNGLTVNVNQGTYVENGIANSANIVMTADSTHDLNGKTATVDTLIGKYVNTSVDMAALNFGNDTDATYAGNFTESANIALVKQGTNTVTLTGEVKTPSLTVNEGTLQVSSNVTSNGATIKNGGTFEVNGATVDLSGGTVENAGEILLNGGTLKLASMTKSATTAGDLNIASGTLNLSGKAEVGNLTFGNAVATVADGDAVSVPLDWEIVIKSATEYGQFVASSATFNPNTEIEIVLDEDYNLNVADTFDIVVANSFALNDAKDGVVNDLANYNWDSLLSDSYIWNLNYVNLDGGGYALRLSVDANAIPEPATWTLLVLGATALVFMRRKR